MLKTEERKYASLLIQSHPAVVFLGPPLTGVLRGIEAILEREEPGFDPAKVLAAYQGDFPDLQIYDGRELGVDEARQIRQDATTLPSCWLRKYIIISYVDRPHYTVAPTFLKLIEEPPEHFSVLLTTQNKKGIPPTIFSRSLIIKVNPSTETEVQWWLNQNGLSHEKIRVQACGGDLGIAESLDPETVLAWREVWTPVIGGGGLPSHFPATWTEKLEDTEESTQLACWILLLNLIAHKTASTSLWLELGTLALNNRNLIQDGRSNKIELSTAIIRAYALAVTIQSRNQ